LLAIHKSPAKLERTCPFVRYRDRCGPSSRFGMKKNASKGGFLASWTGVVHEVGKKVVWKAKIE
jgi:hypothetical protein